MIKWAGYGKLLKQSFFTLLISCFILLGSSFASADHFGDDMAGTIPYTVVYSNVSSTVNSSLNFSNSSGGNWLNLPDVNSYHFYVFWNNGRLYNYSYIGGRNNFYRQGYFDRACKVYADDAFLESPWCVSDNDFTTGNAAEFYGLTNYNFTKAAVYSYDDFQYPHFCFYNANNLYYYCFKGTMIDGNSLSIPDGTTSFSSYAGNSPFGNGTGIILGNGGIGLSSEESALNYYEKHYGRDESICYAGVDSLSYLYGQNGVAFQEGEGLSIFDIFNQLYGNSDLDKVYVWLNSRLINYENRFDPYRDEPSYLSNYNSGTNQVDIYYDNLTFPFANKPVAFYFLASNITSQSERNTMGSSVVSYCNIKINSGTFDEIIDQSQKNNITNYTEKSNTNIGLNPDGTAKQYTGAFLGSGVDLAFSGNTSITNTLKNFFNELNGAINVVNSASTTSILPSWLVIAFLTVVLFRFLKRRK